MTLSDAEKAQLRRLHDRPGHHFFSCCPRCGHLDWRMTKTDAPDDVTVDEDNFMQCARCAEIAAREPEVYRWVLAVFGYQERRSAS